MHAYATEMCACNTLQWRHFKNRGLRLTHGPFACCTREADGAATTCCACQCSGESHVCANDSTHSLQLTCHNTRQFCICFLTCNSGRRQAIDNAWQLSQTLSPVLHIILVVMIAKHKFKFRSAAPPPAGCVQPVIKRSRCACYVEE